MQRRSVHSLLELAGTEVKGKAVSERGEVVRGRGRWVMLPPVPAATAAASGKSLLHIMPQQPKHVSAIAWLKRCCPQISQNDAETLFRSCQEGNSFCYWKQFGLRHFATKGKKAKRTAGSTAEKVLDEKHAALEDALAQISSTFGKETVMWLGRNVAHRNIPVISTGSLSLDFALGVGGLPKGRVVEIYGPEASGKTTLALHVIAEAQKAGGYCVFIDAEHALDPSFAEALGVRTEDLLLAQPDCGEQALSLTDTFIRSGSIDVVVVDSVAALVPRAELDGEMGDAHMAVQARLMSQALRKLAHSLSKSQTILIFINQIRSKLSHGGFGGPIEVTSGGNALKFYASVRLNIRRTGLIKKGEETVGSSVTVKIAKNKVAPPFKTADFEIEFGRGISKEGEIVEFAVKHGLIVKSGNWFGYDGENIANGKENLKRYLREHTDLRDSLLESIKEKLARGSNEEDEASCLDDETTSDHESNGTSVETDDLETSGQRQS